MCAAPSAADIFDSDMATVHRVEQKKGSKVERIQLENFEFW